MEPKNKKLRRNQESDDLDRLSCLPDSILTHILTFLDTKTCIRTSVLSRRYQYLWTLSTCLDFKLSEYQTQSFELYDGYALYPVKNSSVASFESYVNHVLQRREHSNLLAFRLSLHKDVSMEFIQNCIDYAARHKVRHLRVRGFVKRKPFTLPKLLLTSSSLVTLHLHNAISYCIELPKSVALPNLKYLRLKNFEFSDRNFNGELFSGSPRLETLVLSKCCIRPGSRLQSLDVNCLNLKHLEISYWRSPWRCFEEHLINVNAPQLELFKFQGHLARVKFKDGLPCLFDADIDLCYPTACVVVNATERTERKKRTSEVLLNMLRDICNVKLLSLSLRTVEVLSAIPDLRARSPTIFENLRYIKFTAENKYREKTMSIDTVMKLLERAAKASSDIVIVDDSKEPRISLESSKVKCKHTESRHIELAADVMQFILESSPSAEFLRIEIPEIPDQD